MKWIVFSLCVFNSYAGAVRLKDIASIRGVKENQFIGYGLVVGLPGSGDRGGDFTESSLTTALRGLGVDPKSQKLVPRNTAAVLVTANLPAYAPVGGHFDVTVSSIGSATSLEGGTLMMTPLKGADGLVYAIAQGRIMVPRRADRGTTSFQAMLSAQIPNGAILERDLGFDFMDQKELTYQLFSSDFTTAARVATRINEELGGKYATAADPGTIHLILPYGFGETPVDLIAKIEGIEIHPDRVAKVVVNRKTGTVVVGDSVKVAPMAIAHNNLRIIIRDEGREPQAQITPEPAPGPDGELAQNNAPKALTVSNKGTSIAEVVTSLNEVGATADDLVFLLQAMRSTGGLIAELETQ